MIYVVDGTAGIQADDVRWIARLRALPAALLIVINKINLMLDAPAAATLAQMQDQFARPVIALNAQAQQEVHERFLPQMLKACPALTIPLAAEITSLRWRVVGRLIRESAIMSGLVTLENGATVDVQELVSLQRQLVRQIAHVYGYASPDDNGHTSLGTAVQRFFLDSLAHVIARFGPLGRGLAAGLIGASGTWAIGRGAQVHYTGEAPFKHFPGLFRRNGNHGSA